MERADVVVQKPDRNDRPARVATVLSKDGPYYRVRWEDDGAEDVVRIGGPNSLARRGSLRHHALVDPAPVRTWFAQDPVGMVLRLLREQGSKLTARGIKDQLSHLGLDEEAAATAWKAAHRAFAKSDQVEVANKGSGTTYRWCGSHDDSDHSSAAPVVAPAAVLERTGAPDPEDPEGVQPTGPAADDSGTGTGVAEQSRETENGQPAPGFVVEPGEVDRARTADAEIPLREASPRQRKSLLDLIVAATGETVPASLEHFVARPLQTGASLSQIADDTIAELLADLSALERQLAETLLLALPRKSAAASGAHRQPPDGTTTALVLAAAADEIRSIAEPAPEVLSAAAWLLGRASTVHDLPTGAVTPLIALVELVATPRREEDVPFVDASAAALSRLLLRLSRDERVDVSTRLDRLASAFSHLPMTPTGGRARLLAAVGKVHSKSLQIAAWWDGVTLDDLADCATGVLGGVTSRPEVAERYIRPLVAKEFATTTSRLRLAFLLGLPGEFVAGLAPEVMLSAFRRVGSSDPVVAGWLAALGQQDRITTLQQDVERAQADATLAEQRAESVEQQLNALVDRCERLEQDLRTEHVQASALRAAQDRQIKIDVIRSLADLAAEVEELAGEQVAPTVLVDRVRALVSTQGLDLIGRSGQRLTFDPTIHEPVVGTLDEGSTVTVIRPGYRWRFGDEDLLVGKALVTTT